MLRVNPYTRKTPYFSFFLLNYLAYDILMPLTNDPNKVVFEWFDNEYARRNDRWTVRCLEEEQARLYRDGKIVENIQNSGMINIKKFASRGLFRGKAELDVMKFWTGPMKLQYDIKTMTKDSIPISGYCIIDVGVNNPTLFKRMKGSSLRSERAMMQPDLHHKVATEDDVSEVVEDSITFVIRDLIGVTPAMFLRSWQNEFSRDKTATTSGFGLEECGVKLLNQYPEFATFGLYARKFSFIVNEMPTDAMVREESLDLAKAELKHDYEMKVLSYAERYQERLEIINNTRDE